MKNFSFARFLSVMKYIYRFDRKWYLGWTLAAPFLLLSAMALLVVLGLLVEENLITVESVGIMTVGLMFTISPVVVCCTFHPMYNKRRRIAFLSLPASVNEKFAALLVMNALVLVVMAVVMCTINFVVYLTDDSYRHIWNFHYMMVEMRATDLDGMVWAIYAYLYLLLPSLLLFVNSRVYRFNIVPSAVIVGTLNMVGLITFLVLATTVDEPDVINAFFYVVLGLEVVAALALWVLAYRNFKRSQIRDFFNR